MLSYSRSAGRADDRGQICPPLTALLELQSEIGGASGFNAPGGDNRGDGKRYIVHADQKLTAFFKLESACGAASH